MVEFLGGLAQITTVAAKCKRICKSYLYRERDTLFALNLQRLFRRFKYHRALFNGHLVIISILIVKISVFLNGIGITFAA